MTGASGFVGRWMEAHLVAAGDDVVCLPGDVDIRDRDALGAAVATAAPDAVCHLAAQASVRASWDDAGATFGVNTLGTVHLLDAVARLAAPTRVLLVSSAEVYGAVAGDALPIGETEPFRPANPYAASKAAAELAGLQAWLGRGAWVVRARPFNHTGPGQAPDFVVPALARQIVEAAAAGAPRLLVGNVSVRRDLTDVRDVVRAYRLLLERGEPGEVYNVCRGESVAIADLVTRLLRLAGQEGMPVEVDPSRLRPADVPDLRGDNTRLRAATGWRPEIDLDRTLGDVLAYWRQRQASPGA